MLVLSVTAVNWIFLTHSEIFNLRDSSDDGVTGDFVLGLSASRPDGRVETIRKT